MATAEWLCSLLHPAKLLGRCWSCCRWLEHQLMHLPTCVRSCFLLLSAAVAYVLPAGRPMLSPALPAASCCAGAGSGERRGPLVVLLRAVHPPPVQAAAARPGAAAGAAVPGAGTGFGTRRVHRVWARSCCGGGCSRQAARPGFVGGNTMRPPARCCACWDKLVQESPTRAPHCQAPPSSTLCRASFPPCAGGAGGLCGGHAVRADPCGAGQLQQVSGSDVHKRWVGVRHKAYRWPHAALMLLQTSAP